MHLLGEHKIRQTLSSKVFRYDLHQINSAIEKAELIFEEVGKPRTYIQQVIHDKK
jgi:hypothetical protein